MCRPDLLWSQEYRTLGIRKTLSPYPDQPVHTILDDYSHNTDTDHPAETNTDRYLRFMDLIRDTAPTPPDQSFDVEKDLETLLFTGGTTGLPKGCMLTHRNVYTNTLQNFHSLGLNCLLLRGAVSVLIGLPFFHSYGHIIDRTKDMITVSGYKVYSREIDNILFSHEAVEMAATVGIPNPDREGSELVIVFIQPKGQYKNHLDEKQIISYLKEKSAKYAIPKRICGFG